MITVTNYDRNGNIIEDMSQVTINLEDYPAILNAIIKKEDDAA